MVEQQWMLKGVYMECCRANGQCPLFFGRDMTDGPCTNLAVYKVDEGSIRGVDMKGIIISTHTGGIGPKAPISEPIPGKDFDDYAIYISDNATDEQRKILEPFCRTHFMAQMAEKMLGVKFTRIEIKEENNSIHITSPYFDMNMKYAIGGDGKTPIRIENALFGPPGATICKACNAHWSYKDYGKTLEFDQTSGQSGGFVLSGDRW
jgi:hypothetical protein